MVPSAKPKALPPRPGTGHGCPRLPFRSPQDGESTPQRLDKNQNVGTHTGEEGLQLLVTEGESPNDTTEWNSYTDPVACRPHETQNSVAFPEQTGSIQKGKEADGQNTRCGNVRPTRDTKATSPWSKVGGIVRRSRESRPTIRAMPQRSRVATATVLGGKCVAWGDTQHLGRQSWEGASRDAPRTLPTGPAPRALLPGGLQGPFTSQDVQPDASQWAELGRDRQYSRRTTRTSPKAEKE